jgi:hypothetical protein
MKVDGGPAKIPLLDVRGRGKREGWKEAGDEGSRG